MLFEYLIRNVNNEIWYKIIISIAAVALSYVEINL